MPKISIVTRDGAETCIMAESNLSLMENLRNAGVGDITALCGGCCSCATCHVYVLEGNDYLAPLSDDENDMLDSSLLRRENSRLACQVMIHEACEALIVEIALEE